ncbi:HrgA protein [Campylobacter sp. TTU-622]|uniref:HTH domain-containing protein n=1 Tax=unclassified Campylobacter TaxID=2593542 RepID=UPI0019037F89|nr:MULTISPECIES: HTH domain-containing protein [unclassified Campylobacter]MBK1972555.1 HrgA protein [Campylobacter sp. TTU-622]MBK1991161.1 HrgA protein [Campylobacter sp. 2018MI34]
MKKYNFLDLIIEVLKESKFPLSANEIWQYALDKGFEKKLQTYKDGNLSKTPVASLTAKIYVNLNSKNSLFSIVSKRPTKFWLKERENELDLKNIENISTNKFSNLLIQKEIKFKERDLHPLLVKFLFESENFNLYSKTIFHEKSQRGKSGENEWIHPDIVGVHFPFKDYEDETFTLCKNLNQISYKIYSFELKVKLDFSNLRSSYFQAVSNSSWANEGYLVALEFDDEIMKELWRLNNAFGIGFIKLDTDINNSKIIIRAKEKQNLDLITLDLLVSKNEDFKNFIQNLSKDISISDIERIGYKFYDEIYNDEKMQKYLKDKKII